MMIFYVGFAVLLPCTGYVTNVRIIVSWGVFHEVICSGSELIFNPACFSVKLSHVLSTEIIFYSCEAFCWYCPSVYLQSFLFSFFIFYYGVFCRVVQAFRSSCTSLFKEFLTVAIESLLSFVHLCAAIFS